MDGMFPAGSGPSVVCILPQQPLLNSIQVCGQAVPPCYRFGIRKREQVNSGCSFSRPVAQSTRAQVQLYFSYGG